MELRVFPVVVLCGVFLTAAVSALKTSPVPGQFVMEYDDTSLESVWNTESPKDSDTPPIHWMAPFFSYVIVFPSLAPSTTNVHIHLTQP